MALLCCIGRGSRDGTDFIEGDSSGTWWEVTSFDDEHPTGAVSRPLPPEFVRWLEEEPPRGEKPFLEGMDLSGVSLVDFDLGGVWFAECIFDDAILRNTYLDRCILGGCSFRRADLSAALLKKSDSTESTFAGACLAGANLDRLYATGTDFQHADLSGANLLRMAVVRCDLRGASLRQARFQRTSIYEGSLLAGIDLTGASGTVNGGLEINVGTPEAPLVLTAHAALEWMRDAGADVSWSRTPDVTRSSGSRPDASGGQPDGAAQGTSVP